MEDVQLNNLWICYQAAKGNSNKNDKEVFKEVIKNFLISEKAPVAEVPCSVGLEGQQPDKLVELIRGYCKYMDTKEPEKSEMVWRPNVANQLRWYLYCAGYEKAD